MTKHLPFFECGDYKGISARALIWQTNTLSIGTAFQSSSAELLALAFSQTEAPHKIILDCTGIHSIGDHALTKVAEALRNTKSELHLVNAKRCGEEFEMAFRKLGIPKIARNEADYWHYSLTSNATPVDESALKAAFRKGELETMEEVLRRSYRELPNGQERLRSTPLLANGLFNARRIIGNTSDFMFVSTLMAKVAQTHLFKSDNLGSVRFLSVSLRASPFAAALSQMLRIPVEIIDHMGPTIKILEQYTLRNEPPPDSYSYVGDFAIGGSELKIAETYAVTKGSKLNFSIVIGSLLPPELYSKSPELLSLVTISEIEALRKIVGNYQLL